MSRFLNGIKSFVHSISTSDHYAAYDPSRPQGQEDAAPLATSSADRRSSSSSANAGAGASGYSSGMRSQQMGSSGAGGIPLSDFNRDGPPIPSPTLSWNRIDTWIEQNYPELFDQVLGGATANDLNDLEHDLDCALPPDVRESFEVHDGQEKGGKPTGIFYGVTLLDLEGVSEEWNVWRQTAIRLEEMQQRRRQQQSGKASSSGVPPSQQPDGLAWMDGQTCCPPETVQHVYAHPGWIPLAKDFDGNNIAVDLAPGPKGRYGQVILFGRDFDVKYAVAPSWGDFLAQFAADLESGNCFIDDDVDNAVFAFKAPDGRLVSYFNVLRQRIERTVPSKPSIPRRSAMSAMSASVSNAPVNSGRTTPRLVSPTSSTTSLQRTTDPIIKLEPGNKNTSSTKLAEGLNEIDLSEGQSNVGKDTDKEATRETSEPSDKEPRASAPAPAPATSASSKDDTTQSSGKDTLTNSSESSKAEKTSITKEAKNAAKNEVRNKVNRPEEQAAEGSSESKAVEDTA